MDTRSSKETKYPNDPANLKVVSLGPLGEMTTEFIYRKESNKMKTPIPLRAYDKLNNEFVIIREYISFIIN